MCNIRYGNHSTVHRQRKVQVIVGHLSCGIGQYRHSDHCATAGSFCRSTCIGKFFHRGGMIWTCVIYNLMAPIHEIPSYQAQQHQH